MKILMQGIASPLELIAHDHGHNRAIEEIAKHIGADRVIFQDLEDLKSACSEAVVSSRSSLEEREFEVGVFCGSYVTPVEQGYFQHLENIRGETRKMKVLEKAREAVANGSADLEEIEITAKGVDVTQNGQIVPTTTQGKRKIGDAQLNGDAKRQNFSREGMSFQKDQMDISLHNYGDFPGR